MPCARVADYLTRLGAGNRDGGRFMTTETGRFTTARQRLAAVSSPIFGGSCQQVVLAWILGVVVIAALGCGRDTSSEDLSTTLTHTISRGDLSVMVTEQGMLESSSNKEIKCKVRGQGNGTLGD